MDMYATLQACTCSTLSNSLLAGDLNAATTLSHATSPAQQRHSQGHEADVPTVQPVDAAAHDCDNRWRGDSLLGRIVSSMLNFICTVPPACSTGAAACTVTFQLTACSSSRTTNAVVKQ